MRKIAFKFGFAMAAGFILLFVSMHFLRLSHHYYLRVLNGLIHVVLLTLAIRAYSRQVNVVDNYLQGVVMGMFTSVVGVLTFSIFMFFFLVFDKGFMQQLQADLPIGEYLNPVTASLIIFMEGTVVSLITSYIITRVLGMNAEAHVAKS
ncbi:MAG: hypothetical protein D6816_15455 [Bacteroidetes bacterium]|nr:MAG: hypothetical protein D6816_15455 [Bacteroidota bacterium]